MFQKTELLFGAFLVGAIVFALYLTRLETAFIPVTGTGQVASPVAGDVVVVENSENRTQARADAYLEATNRGGEIDRLVVDDITIGNGPVVGEGDQVQVHYIGTLQNGQEFDNSKKRGQPFEFTVGAGQVIPGWEQGLLGMQVGGERILVIPPELAYGATGVGPIPGNATLIFAIELLEIN